MEENFDNCMEEIGKRIKMWRTGRGLSQKEFAFLSNTTQSHVSECERGLTKMQIVTLIKFAAVLEISMMEFFESNKK